VLDQIDSLLEAMLAANNPLDTRISSLNSQAGEVAEDRVVMEQRLLTMEARYRKQFNALDILLTDLNSTGSFVADQLANIPIPGKTKK
jgi:flagellar hook-associated protein 2